LATESAHNRAALGFAVLVLALTAMAVGVTLLASFMWVEEASGFVFWMRTLFLCGIELLAGLLALHALLPRSVGWRPSGATLVGSYTAIGVYAVIGLISILAYQYLRDAEDPADNAFGAYFILLTAGFFGIAIFLYGWDLFYGAKTRPIQEKRDEHMRRARSLQIPIRQLRGLHVDDGELARDIDQAIKRLERIDANLRHSHGGGAGSLEHPSDQTGDRAADLDIAVFVEEIADTAGRMASLKVTELREAIRDLQHATVRLSESIDARELA